MVVGVLERITDVKPILPGLDAALGAGLAVTPLSSICKSTRPGVSTRSSLRAVRTVARRITGQRTDFARASRSSVAMAATSECSDSHSFLRSKMNAAVR